MCLCGGPAPTVLRGGSNDTLSEFQRISLKHMAALTGPNREFAEATASQLKAGEDARKRHAKKIVDENLALLQQMSESFRNQSLLSTSSDESSNESDEDVSHARQKHMALLLTLFVVMPVSLLLVALVAYLVYYKHASAAAEATTSNKITRTSTINRPASRSVVRTRQSLPAL